MIVARRFVHALPAPSSILAMLAMFAAFAMPAFPARAAAAASAWPVLPVPPGAQAFDVGQDLRIDGLAMQVRGFLSPEPPARLVAWFRAQLGDPLVTSGHDGKTLLGQFRHGYYLTVQLENAGGGTRALLAQSDMRALLAQSDMQNVTAGRASFAEHADWQSRLPQGMRILSLVQSRDGERRSQHLVLQSPGTLTDSAQALSRMLGRAGYAPIGGPVPASQGLVLQFQRPGGDAMAVLHRGPDGSTSAVLSTSTPAGDAR